MKMPPKLHIQLLMAALGSLQATYYQTFCGLTMMPISMLLLRCSEELSRGNMKRVARHQVGVRTLSVVCCYWLQSVARSRLVSFTLNGVGSCLVPMSKSVSS